NDATTGVTNSKIRYITILANQLIQYKLAYCFLVIPCLCNIAEVKPISLNSSINPITKVTNAINPKSDLSRKRVKTDTFSIATTAKTTVLTVVHFTPVFTCLSIDIYQLIY